MIVIVREIVKLLMFTILWALPIILVKLLGSSYYLWFFALSLLGTVGLFSHYEDLERCNTCCFNSDTEDDE